MSIDPKVSKAIDKYNSLRSKQFNNGKLVLCTSHICENYECVFKQPRNARTIVKHLIDWKPFLDCRKFR